jgi:tetratricopeptide (TPR) repeat protein
MNPSLAQQAVSSALSGNWDVAIEMNLAILKDNPKDLDALNRLARAYAEKGQIGKARDEAEKVIKIDPFNSIATKALRKWKDLKKGDVCSSALSDPEAYLEEPGKTKILSLLHLGSQEVLAKLDSGDEIKLDCHCHRIAAVTRDGKYIGRFPDDLSSRLKRLVSLGNEYQSLVKSIDPTEVTIFVREVIRGSKAKDIVSFPAEKIEYTSFTSPSLIRKSDEAGTPTENEAEEA